jgi:HprK-related kinase A
MRVSEIPEPELAAQLAGAGIGLDFGAARARVRGDAVGLAKAIAAVYRDFSIDEPSGFFDVTVRLRRAYGIRRFLREQIELVFDGGTLFAPYPADTHLPMLEWGINFLIAQRLGFHLLLHAGVVELGGKAIILPALPGTGKSTLTAALATRGFRLLSDEFGVVRFSDGQLLPLLRPVALKNESIDVIARFAPRATIGPRFPKTRKGTVAHLAPEPDAVERRHEPAQPALIVFPRYDSQVELEIEPEMPSRAFGRLAVNSFNYEMLGPAAFDAVSRLVRSSRVYRLAYSDLDRATAALRELLAACG